MPGRTHDASNGRNCDRGERDCRRGIRIGRHRLVPSPDPDDGHGRWQQISGSLLMDRGLKAVGLLFAGSSQITVHNHIADVEAALGVRPVCAPTMT